MEYVAARTPETEREVYLPAEHSAAWLESAEILLEPARLRHDRALRALRARRVPEALAHIEEALQLAPYDPDLVEAAALIALQHDDHALARRAIRRMEQFGLEEAALFRDELEARIQRWNAHLEHPEALRDKYAAADPDASYRELLLLRDRFGGQLTPREQEHLRRWRLTAPKTSVSSAHRRDVSRSVLTGVAAVGLGMALRTFWKR